MEEFKSNSHKSREARSTSPDKRIEKVTSGAVRTKKKSDVSKLTDVFITEDVNSVKSYILFDVLVPTVKNALSEIVKNGIDVLLFGETGGTKRKSSSSRVSYRSYYDSGNDRRDYSSRRPARSDYDYEDIVMANRGDAERVLDQMNDLIARYDMVSIADLYDLAGISHDYTSCKYGWTNLSNAYVQRERGGGYIIKLPKALPFD